MVGSFFRVRCPDCEHEQILFDRAATQVSCASCDRVIATPTGGKAVIDAEILETEPQ